MSAPRRTMTWNALSAMATQATSATFTVVLTLYLTRVLSPSGYGLFGLAAAVGGLFLLPADFGVSASASRYIAENRENPDEVGGIFSSAVRLKLVLTVGTGTLLFVLAPAIAAAYGIGGLTWPVRAIAISIVAQSFMNTFCYGLTGLARTSLNVPIYFVQSALETGLGIGLVALGGGAAAAIFGRAIGYVVAAGMAAFIVTRVVGRRLAPWSEPARRWSRPVRRYGGALVIVDSAYTLFNQIDALLIGALLDARAVGLYSAPLRLIGFLGLPANAIATAVGPRMAAVAGDRADGRYLIGAGQIVAYVQIAALPPLVLWPGPIVQELFGGEFAHSASILRAFTPFVFLLGFGMLFSVATNYLGQARSRVPIAIGTAVINVVADLILIPIVGVVGGAIGTDIAYLFYGPAHIWICVRTVRFAVAPLLRACLRGAVAAAAMGAIMVLAVGTDPGLLGMFGGFGAGLIGYALVLLVSGAVPELRRIFKDPAGGPG